MKIVGTMEEIGTVLAAHTFRDAAERAEFVAAALVTTGDTPALIELERSTSAAAIQAGRELLEALEAAVPALREGDAAATGDTGTAVG